MSTTSFSPPVGVRFDVRCLRCDLAIAEPFDPCPSCLEEGVSVNGTVRYHVSEADGARRKVAGLSAGVHLPVAIAPQAPTPLRRTPRAAAALGLRELHYKDECGGPTWSWKDRLAHVAVAHAAAAGAETVVVSSSGNHGAAVAAAAAATGLSGVVLTTVGIAPAMSRLIRGSGGHLIALAEAKDRWTMMRDAVRERGWYPASNFHDPPIGSSPFAVEGYKPIATETILQLGAVPDWVVVPVGYGDGLAGIARGFAELVEAGIVDRAPRMLAAETSGSLREALASGRDQPVIQEVRAPSALSIACPQATFQALHALRTSGGAAVVVDENMALRARRTLGDLEGAFHELSSAVTLAAVSQARAQGLVGERDLVVAVASSPGLKDQQLPGEHDGLLSPIPATLAALDTALAAADGRDATVARA